MKSMMMRLGMDDSQPLQSKVVSRAVESAQKRVEGNNFDARKRLLQYDDVLRQQREIIYKERYDVLETENMRVLVEVSREDWNLKAIEDFVAANLLEEGQLKVADFQGKSAEDINQLVSDAVHARYDEKEAELTPERMREFEKVILLRSIDTKWIDHIDAMDQLRQGIHLRAYGQNDPLREYQQEGFAMFEDMVASIREDVAKYAMKAEIRSNLEREEVAKGQAVNPKEEGSSAPKKQPVRKSENIGRNDLCPCGSGKKFKNCHGAVDERCNILWFPSKSPLQPECIWFAVHHIDEYIAVDKKRAKITFTNGKELVVDVSVKALEYRIQRAYLLKYRLEKRTKHLLVQYDRDLTMIELADVRNVLDTTAKNWRTSGGLFDLENKEARIQELDEMMLEPGFWDDQQGAQVTINEGNGLKAIVNEYKDLVETHENLDMTLELLQEEPDEELQEELGKELAEFQQKMGDFELQLLYTLVLGGTESQDWGSMLLRMYTRWAEKRGFKVETVDYLPGDEAGIKSVTLSIKGHNAFGYLQAEKGVHRLVRISPFDSSGRRHTSFVSCDVMPEFDENIEIDIRTEDLKIDTYRATGAGGQHINTTDSAVRITHIPTGTVVQCQAERSQIKNREKAMTMLKGKLYQLELDKQQAQLDEIRGEQKEIGWGSQIRSYVFHPYSMVKDHRTNEETGNVGAVMDGDLDPFINAYLRSKIG
ncbi:hypothetical protein NQ314_003649 [Rhamnusium bicolor]|uniref:Prokaryotic-type class I peptide chain release factors domain-containing protein n=1 Tax=Rhamnusium bicolor TaxID=1586634 RepID=A0AAV8ZNT7_9CUCU|nr:hypothetical protein NQ314_003649 [Rhamnusium bicolor]